MKKNISKIFLSFFVLAGGLFFAPQPASAAVIPCPAANIIVTGDSAGFAIAGYTKVRVSLSNAGYTKPSNISGFYFAPGNNAANGNAGSMDNELGLDLEGVGHEIVWSETTSTYTTFLIKKVGKFHFEGYDEWNYSSGGNTATGCGFMTDGVEFGQSRMITSQGFKISASSPSYNVTKPAPANISVTILPRLTQNNLNLGWSHGAVTLDATTPQNIGSIVPISATPFTGQTVVVNTNLATVSSQVVTLLASYAGSVIASSGDDYSPAGPTINIAGATGGVVSCPALAPINSGNSLQFSSPSVDMGASVTVSAPSGFTSSSTTAFAGTSQVNVGLSSTTSGVTSALITGVNGGIATINSNTTWDYTNGSGNATGCNLNSSSINVNSYSFSMPPLLTSTAANTGNYLLPVRLENSGSYSSPITVSFTGAPAGSQLCDEFGANCAATKVVSFAGASFKELRLSVPTSTIGTSNIFLYANSNGLPAISRRTDFTVASTVLAMDYFRVAGSDISGTSYPGTLITAPISNGSSVAYSWSTQSIPANTFCELAYYYGNSSGFAGYLPPGPSSHATIYSSSMTVSTGTSAIYFKLYCNNSVTGQSTTLWAYANLTPTAAVTLTPSSNIIKQGDSVSLTWTGTNLASGTPCQFSSTTNGNHPTALQSGSGSVSVTPGVATSITYTISCAPLAGTVNATASVTVNIADIQLFTASGSPIVNQSSTVTLTWSTQNLNAGNPCTLSRLSPSSTLSTNLPGPNVSGYTYPVTFTPTAVGPIVYTLTCGYASGTISKTATVNVIAISCPAATIQIVKTYGSPANQAANKIIRGYGLPSNSNMLRILVVHSGGSAYNLTGSPSFQVVTSAGVTITTSALTTFSGYPSATFKADGNVGNFQIRAVGFNNANGATGCTSPAIADSPVISSQDLSPIYAMPDTSSLWQGGDPFVSTRVSLASGSAWGFGSVYVNKFTLPSEVNNSTNITGKFYSGANVENTNGLMNPVSPTTYLYTFECTLLTDPNCPNDQTYSGVQMYATAVDSGVGFIVPSSRVYVDTDPALNSNGNFTILPPADFTLLVNNSSASTQSVVSGSTVAGQLSFVGSGFNSCQIARKDQGGSVLSTHPLSPITSVITWSNFNVQGSIEATCTHSSGATYSPKIVQVAFLNPPINPQVQNKLSFDPLVFSNTIDLGCKQIIAYADDPGVGKTVNFSVSPNNSVYVPADNASPVNGKYYKVFTNDSNGAVFGLGAAVTVQMRTVQSSVYSASTSPITVNTASNCTFSLTNSDIEVRKIADFAPYYRGSLGSVISNPENCDGKTSEMSSGTPYPKIGEVLDLILHLCNNTSTNTSFRNPTSQATGTDGLLDITFIFTNLASNNVSGNWVPSDFVVYDRELSNYKGASTGSVIPSEQYSSCGTLSGLEANQTGFCLRVPASNLDPNVKYPLNAGGRFRVEFKGKLMDPGSGSNFGRWKVDADMAYKKINSSTSAIIPWDDNLPIQFKASTGLQIYQRTNIRVDKEEVKIN